MTEHEHEFYCVDPQCSAALPEPPLDVDRLAAAIYNCDLADPIMFHVQTVDKEAARIAAEYDRLARFSESGSPTPQLDPISGLPEHIVGAIASEIAGPTPSGEER